MNDLRVLHISHATRDLSAGAAGTSLLLNSALRRLGVDVVEMYLGRHRHSRLAERWERELVATKAAMVAATHQDFDVIDATGHMPWQAFELLRRRTRRPLLVARSYGLEVVDHLALHRRVHRASSRLTLWQEEQSNRGADFAILPTGQQAGYVVSQGWKSADEVTAIAHGLPSELLQAHPKSDYDWHGVIVWCGSAIARKGWDLFTAGSEHLQGLQRIDLMGAGRAEDALRAEFPVGVRDRVVVHHKLSRAEQATLLRSADAFVSMSRSEGFHLALLEAMQLGLPVLATRTGFVADLTVPDLVGIREIIQTDDPQSLSRAWSDLQRLGADGRRELGRRGRQYAQCHTWETTAVRTHNAYRSALSRRAR